MSVSLIIKNDCILIDDNLWFYLVVDASGLPESDFLWGNSYWMGSRKSCEFIQDPPLFYLSLHDHRNLTTVSTPMSVEYRVFFIRHKSKFQIVLANVGSVSNNLIMSETY